MVDLSEGQVDKWRDYWLCFDVLKQIEFSHIIARKLDKFISFQAKELSTRERDYCLR